MSSLPALPPRFVLPVADLVDQLLTNPRWADGVVHHRTLPARDAAFEPWPTAIVPRVRDASALIGAPQLFTHQAEAVQKLLGGAHVAVVAGTASGKSLCYQLPIAQALATDPRATAVCLFPTKALARDQLTRFEAWDRALAEFGAAAGEDNGGLGAVVYDGDTPTARRAALRRQARVVLTNPDMLHLSLLPRHPAWAAFFEGLTYVVVDEMHVYRGVFGSHVANVLRRLTRIARFYGARPRFVLTSATIANPGEHASRLVGAPVDLVDGDGAPRGRRSFLFYNPPLVDEGMNLRRSALLEAEAAARHFIAGGAQTIVFARSRQSAEIIARYVRQGGAQPAPGRPDPALAAVKTYRSGYTPAERRAVEAGLRSGELRGVVATNALELGIDIGALDVCVMAGYPGSIASTWQQAGRVGRQQFDAAALLVASGAPLDQYILRQPDYFFARSPEHARIQPDNLLVLLGHVRSAAFELPFDQDEAERPFGGSAVGSLGLGVEHRLVGPSTDPSSPPDPLAPPELLSPPDHMPPPDLAPNSSDEPPLVGELLAVLEAGGEVQRRGDRWYWTGQAYPAAELGLRSAGPDVVAILVGPQNPSAPAHAHGHASRVAGLGRDVPADRGAFQVASAPPTLVQSDNASPTGQGSDRSLPAGYALLGTVERAAAPRMVHAGAVYLHGADTYRVEALDWEGGRAYVVPTDDSLYTRASTSVTIRPTRTAACRPSHGAEVAFGELEVFSRTTSYRQVRFGTHETVGWGTIDLPEQHHLAGGYWFMLTEEAVEALKAIGHWEVDISGERGPNWAEARHSARARDGFACRLCGAPERPDRQHDVHHLRPFRDFGWQKGANDAYRLANDLDNLITLCRGCHRVAERALGLAGGLGGVGYALAHLAPLFLMCDGADIGVQAESHAPWAKRPAVTVYEQAPGGVGFGEQLYALHERIVHAAIELISGCPCRLGCPSCIGAASALDPRAKTHALVVLGAVAGGR